MFNPPAPLKAEFISGVQHLGLGADIFVTMSEARSSDIIWYEAKMVKNCCCIATVPCLNSINC